MTHAPRTRRFLVRASVAATASAGLVAALLAVPAARAADEPSTPRAALSDLAVVGDGTDGHPAIVAAPPGSAVERPDGLSGAASDVTVAEAHLDDVSSYWEVPSDSLRATSTTEVDGLGPVVRFAQLVDGVPVYGGGLVVSLDDDGGLRSVGGDTASASTRLDFRVSEQTARRTALAAAARELQLPASRLLPGPATRYAFDPELVGGEDSVARAAYRVVVATPVRSSATKAEVIVDAGSGAVIQAHGSTPHLNRAICDSGGDDSWSDDAAYGYCGENRTRVARDTNHDGIIISTPAEAAFWGAPMDSAEAVTVPYTRTEAQAASGIAEVNNGYDTLGNTAAFYLDVLGYDLTAKIGSTGASVGGSGSTRLLAGIVRYCDPVELYYFYVDSYEDAETLAAAYCPTPNAGWAGVDPYWEPGEGTYPGGQMFIGRGLAASEDVIGHELTHGVTEATSNLIYANESGAINESMSDVFGQLVQVWNQPSTDSTWLVGDGLSADPGTQMIDGPIRSMSNPPTTSLFEGSPQPDHMNSPRWDTDPFGDDAGGVHTNSGVGNKAAYLIAKGGTFNGVSVRALDTANAFNSKLANEKVAHLYWRTLNTLPANANYRRLAHTMYQSCLQLAGANLHGFVTADCNASVLPALRATKMTATSVAVTTSRTSLNYGTSVTVAARVRDARGSTTSVTSYVRLERRLAGSSAWSSLGTATTSGGRKSWAVKPTRNASYRVVALANGALPTTVSAAYNVGVKAKVSRSVNKTKISFGKSFTVKGALSPNLVGRTVYLQRYSGGKWRTVKSDKLNRSSKYVLKYKPRSRADLNHRVYLKGSTTLSSSVSTKFKIKVS